MDLSITDHAAKRCFTPFRPAPCCHGNRACPLEAIEFPAENDGIPIADVLYNGVSILNNPDSACRSWRTRPRRRPLGPGRLEALATSVSWYEPLSLVDTCGFVTEAMVRVRNCDIPNVFTPRRPGWQQLFRIPGLSNLEGTRLVVLNRHGVEVWSDQTTSNAQSELVWNGRHPNGDQRGRWTLPMGVSSARWPAAARQSHVFRSP